LQEKGLVEAKFGSSPVLTLLSSLGFSTHKLLARFLEESHCGRVVNVLSGSIIKSKRFVLEDRGMKARRHDSQTCKFVNKRILVPGLWAETSEHKLGLLPDCTIVQIV